MKTLDAAMRTLDAAVKRLHDPRIARRVLAACGLLVTPHVSPMVEGCGLRLAGHLLDKESGAGYHGESEEECRFAADETIDALASRFASRRPPWRESRSKDETHTWVDPRGGMTVRARAVSDDVGAQYLNARTEVHVFTYGKPSPRR